MIDAVRDATDLIEVVQRHLTLSRRGNSWVGLCPFHDEKTPSFHVVPSKQIFHCFGCQVGGDVFRFLMQIEGVSFGEAVRELAGAAGITIEDRELSVEERRAMRARATLYDVLEEAARFFESTLWTRAAGKVGRDYLNKRAITDETARAWRLGHAPGGWTTLLDHMHRVGHDPRLVVEAGLARESDRREGSHYDTFRERVIIPIHDDRGRIVAFGGRLLEGDGPKYINSPETRLYQKSRTLYGLHTARGPIQRSGRCVVVEGYFDVISLHQAGFTEAIATCGTALTPDHLQKISRLAQRVVVLTDADEAGARAAEKALPMFLEAGLLPYRLDLPDAKDPDELVREHGADAMHKAMDTSLQPLLEWVVNRRLLSLTDDSAAREAVVRELLPILPADLPSGTLMWLAPKLRMSDVDLRHRIEALRRDAQTGRSAETPRPTSAPVEPQWRPSRDETHLLWLLAHRYDAVADIVSRSDPGILPEGSPLRPVVARLVTGEPVAAIVPDLDGMLQRTLLAVAAREELYTPDEAALGVCQILERLAAPRRAAVLRQLTREVRNNPADTTIVARRMSLVHLKNELERALKRGDVATYAAMIERESALGSTESAP